MSRSIPLAFVTVLSALTATAGAADGGSNNAIQGELSFSSDYLFRGVSRSGSDAAMSGAIAYYAPSGLYGSLTGTTVDSVTPALEDNGELELQYTLGYRNRWHQDWSWSTQFVYYDYPSADNGANPAYPELQVSAVFREWLTGTVSYSNDFLNSDETGLNYEIEATYPLAGGISILGTLGYAEIDNAYDTDYRYGSIGLQKAWNKMDFSVLYQATDDDAEVIFGELADDEFMIKATTRF